MTEFLIDSMVEKVRESFDHKLRTHRKQGRQQCLPIAKKKRSKIKNIRKVIKLQLRYLKRNRTRLDTLNSCGSCFLAAGRTIDQKLLVVSELVRQQTILDHSESRTSPDRFVRLRQAHVWPIVCGKACSIVEFGAKISISVTGDGVSFLDRLSFNPYNEGEDLGVQALAYRRRHGCTPEVICNESHLLLKDPTES